MINVLVRAIGQRQVMLDTKATKPLSKFMRCHGSAIITHQRAWESAFQKSLRKTMNQYLCVLVEKPLNMRTDPEQSSIIRKQIRTKLLPFGGIPSLPPLLKSQCQRPPTYGFSYERISLTLICLQRCQPRRRNIRLTVA